MVYSVVDLVVPVGNHVTGAAFVVYLADGPFYGNLALGQLAVSVRCGFIALSYGILIIHFIYRYAALFDHNFMNQMLRPSGLFGLSLFFLCHGIVWSFVCEWYLYGDNEVRDYIYEDFKNTYNVDSHDLSMLIALYFNGSFEITRRSWTGITILTGISMYAVITYIILGWKIMHELPNKADISKTTQQLLRQLFRALAVQTLIPIVISFFPCAVAWFSPVLGIKLGMWIEYMCVISVAVFPVLDPLAIIFLLSNYRKKVIRIAKCQL